MLSSVKGASFAHSFIIQGKGGTIFSVHSLMLGKQHIFQLTFVSKVRVYIVRTSNSTYIHDCWIGLGIDSSR